MTALCFDWESAHRCGEAWISQHRLRYELFVRRQGWDVPHYNGLEYDQFDTPAAKYIVRLDTDGQACGITRLLPTTRPYMIRTIWPRLVDHRFEEGESIWEATRFGVTRAIPPNLRRRVVHELIAACQAYGLRHGISRYLCVMPLKIYSHVIEKAGCPVEFVGPPVQWGRHRIAAARLEVSAQVLQAVQQSGGLSGSPLVEVGLASEALVAGDRTQRRVG